jgi:hypothetical protein
MHREALRSIMKVDADTIAVVTHSGFIIHNLPVERPPNCGILKATLVEYADSRLILEDVSEVTEKFKDG